jgi:hypothetical protein
MHILYDLPHNASKLFLAPLNIPTLLPRILMNLEDFKIINLKTLNSSENFLHKDN